MADEMVKATEGPQGLATRPSFIDRTDKTGTEHITKDDLRLPRLAIAQGLSKQMIETESVYIPGLRLFDMFNDMSNEIYGRGPLMFVPLHHQTVRIEFDPKDGNQVLDRNVPANDPRMQWTTDEHGEGVPPRATKFTEFVCILWNLNRKVWEPIVISIKETNKFQRRAAEKLLGYVKFQDGPIFAGYKHVESKPEKNDSGTFGVYRFDNAGFIEDEQFYNMCKKQALGFEGKVVETTREAGDETGDGEVVNATSSKEVPF